MSPKAGVPLTLFAILVGASQPVAADDLLQIYEQAAARDPVVSQARAQLTASRENLPIARSALLPNVAANAQISRHRLELNGLGPLGPAGAMWYTDRSYSVSLAQPLFNGRTWPALRAAKAQISAAEANLIAARQNLIVRTTNAYFGVLNAIRGERIAQSELERLQALQQQAEAFLKAGTGEIIALREAQSRVAGARAALINAQSQHRIADQTLQRLTGTPANTIADLGNFEPQDPEPASIQPWIESAESSQPTLKAAREQLQAAREQIEVISRERWPTLSLNGGYSYDEGGFTGTMTTKDTFVGLQASIPLYEGGQIAARTRQARAQAEASRFALQDLNDDVRLSTETAFLQLQDSAARLRALQEQVQSARTSLEATRKGREIGTRTNIDVLNAVQILASAERQLNDAQYNHILARVRLKQVAGVLSEADIRSLNAMLTP
ncbi:TolC family outer membrane protein [Thermithiobacillus plumbiphilus]|uniref:TolC family outer membrane protein n=1 Tax=Thermithiobacillus plumbiphilus TaxID=1729899 RepID=A0ABU9D7L7_9PROT